MNMVCSKCGKCIDEVYIDKVMHPSTKEEPFSVYALEDGHKVIGSFYSYDILTAYCPSSQLPSNEISNQTPANDDPPKLIWQFVNNNVVVRETGNTVAEAIGCIIDSDPSFDILRLRVMSYCDIDSLKRYKMEMI